MKKIFVVILAFSAFLASCSSPYYPEYHQVVSLGAQTSSLICPETEGTTKLSIISNVEYKAEIISGYEWLSFADTEGCTRIGKGNEFIEFNHMQNNNDKRVARLVLSSGERYDTVKIKQYGRFEDVLAIHDDDKELFSMENGTRMPIAWEGGDVSFRLRTSCLDYELSGWSSDKTILNNFKFENGVCSFFVAANDEQQPRIVTFNISYVDGWEDTKTLALSIRQGYNPSLAGDND